MKKLGNPTLDLDLASLDSGCAGVRALHQQNKAACWAPAQVTGQMVGTSSSYHHSVTFSAFIQTQETTILSTEGSPLNQGQGECRAGGQGFSVP